ncbi:hypothetical protein GCM10011320_38650 [Neoroseomonas lacus]|uniref:Tetratricopeptide repeat protein n=1 Tax=Neoroseomonas lacus TaxID=287609 RepID=A0A917NV12_9PROT|nr:hypothetical protein [Neoroseomonas lacus]GGJ27663.1 hypothetical protein GCM10011320_38650 [Neoroseomonas lacus]
MRDPPAYSIAAAAVSARHSGQAARAVVLYRRAIAAGKTGTETRLGLGLGLALAEAAAARTTLAEAEAIDPGSPRIAQVVAEIARPPAPPSILPRIDALLDAGHPFDALALLEPGRCRWGGHRLARLRFSRGRRVLPRHALLRRQHPAHRIPRLAGTGDEPAGLETRPATLCLCDAEQRAGHALLQSESDLETGITASLTWFAWKRYEGELRVRFVATASG